MSKSRSINVKGTEVTILQKGKVDYISLTDMVKGFGDDTLIYSWMRNRNTLEFIGIWEEMNNPSFKGLEIHTDAIKEILIPKELTRQQINFVYANEAAL